MLQPLVVAAAALVLAARCAGPAAAPQPPAAMRPIPAEAHLFTATQSAGGEPGVQVYRDRAAWEAAWRALHAGLAAGPAPPVDFAREMVVVAAAGDQPSGGHLIRVDGTSEAPGGGLVVHVTRTVPAPDCMTAAVMTAPVDVVRVPRAAGAVRGETRTVAQPCG